MPSLIFAQIKGFVMDSEANPIEGVSIFLIDYNMLVTSNGDGAFTINKDLPNNTYLEFTKQGYKNKVITYSKEEKIEVVLSKLHVELDEIGIKETYSVLGNSKTLNIEHKSLSNNFISSTSLVENIAQLPGLNSIGSGLGIQKVVIRGLSGLRVVTYLNGMRIANQEWANDHGIGFTDLGLGSIELIKGASALKYGGDAVGGVLYFKDIPFEESERPSGYVATKFDNSHFLFSNQFGLKWSIDRLYVNMYGQQSISSDYRLPHEGNTVYLFNSRLRNQSLKSSVAYLSDKIQSVFRYQYNSEQLGIPAHAHGNLNNITLESITLNSIKFNEDFEITRPTQYINNHLFVFENKYFSNKVKYNLFAGYFSNNLQEFDKWTRAAFDMLLSTATLRFDVSMPINYFIINSGVQYQAQSNFNNITDRLIPDSDSKTYSIYSTIDYEKGKYGLNSGVRLDFMEINCEDYDYNKLFSSFNSSLGLFYKHKSHLARITYSGSYRAPHLSELFSYGVHHGTMKFEIGNIDLGIEKSHQFDLKYQWNNDHVGLVVNPFMQVIENFIEPSPSDSLFENRYVIYNYNQISNVEISGFEMGLHYHPHFLHNIHIEQSYSFINALNKDNDSFVSMTPSNKIKTTFNLDLSSYKIPSGLKSIKIYHMHSFAQDNVSIDETPSDSYSLFNIDLSFNPLNNLMCNVGVNNIFNEKYVPHLSRIKDIAGGIPHPGRSFNVSVKFDF